MLKLPQMNCTLPAHHNSLFSNHFPTLHYQPLQKSNVELCFREPCKSGIQFQIYKVRQNQRTCLQTAHPNLSLFPNHLKNMINLTKTALLHIKWTFIGPWMLTCLLTSLIHAAERPVLDTSGQNKEARPQDDFFEFANGDWSRTPKFRPTKHAGDRSSCFMRKAATQSKPSSMN